MIVYTDVPNEANETGGHFPKLLLDVLNCLNQMNFANGLAMHNGGGGGSEGSLPWKLTPSSTTRP